ncbi:hypothetical protein GAGA_0091 [Paraglaciecola agarilytica NO2]|uniref:Uncharacterized protein n=1 Tax=Paraglaciecola agarilytica NO2 TaxID=1125747 RepID=A0ABQ0I0W6_9ALTE|nr:hypothetical protein GAGA_0091 [Paraglaciecola agarilytica NO2]
MVFLNQLRLKQPVSVTRSVQLKLTIFGFDTLTGFAVAAILHHRFSVLLIT